MTRYRGTEARKKSAQRRPGPGAPRQRKKGRLIKTRESERARKRERGAHAQNCRPATAALPQCRSRTTRRTTNASDGLAAATTAPSTTRVTCATGGNTASNRSRWSHSPRPNATPRSGRSRCSQVWTTQESYEDQEDVSRAQSSPKGWVQWLESLWSELRHSCGTIAAQLRHNCDRRYWRNSTARIEWLRVPEGGFRALAVGAAIVNEGAPQNGMGCRRAVFLLELYDYRSSNDRLESPRISSMNLVNICV